jgi:hypothetical protein
MLVLMRVAVGEQEMEEPFQEDEEHQEGLRRH